MIFASSLAVAAVATTAAPRNRYFGQNKQRLSVQADEKIKHLLSDFDKINRQPEYQRDISWSEKMMSEFIASVMIGRTITPILLYRYQNGEDTSDEKYKVEVIDGQHRLFTINAFRNSTWTYLSENEKDTNGKRVLVHLPPIEEDGNFKYIFYKKTADTEKWGKEKKRTVEYLSADDKELFDNTVIITKTIISPLTMEERIEDFLSLQKGRPVRGSDLLKNEIKCGIISHFKTYNYKNKMADLIKHCTSTSKKFYINWAVKCFWLFRHANTNNLQDESTFSTKYRNSEDIFVIRDPDIGIMINEHDPNLDVTEKEFIGFDEQFNKILKIFSEFDGAKFNRTQLFALFCHLCDNRYNHEHIRGYMKEFEKTGKNSELKNLWESSKKEPRRTYFKQCLLQLRDMEHPAFYEHKQPDKKTKQKVWQKCTDRKCAICKQTIITEGDYHVGHITARARRGKNDIDNLLPMCPSCNLRMGTRNAYEFQKDEFPHIYQENVQNGVITEL